MFISKRRPITISQAEHQKLAGTLAMFWGNDQFGLPPIAFESFHTGIALHDRVYGVLDNLPIGAISESEWIALTWRGFDMTWDDPLADLIAKRHLQRLMSYGNSEERQQGARTMAATIAALVAQHGLDAALFDRIDRITDLCDRIAFDFCFEEPAQGSVKVFPRNDQPEEIAISYHVDGAHIHIAPWPLRVEALEGYLVAYQLDGYPERLEPVLVPWQAARRET